MIETMGSADWAVRLAPLLAYPEHRFSRRVEEVKREIGSSLPEAAKFLQFFLDEISDRDDAEMEELYTRTFDIAPQCIPYLSIHRFGEENYRRATLMVGLVECYRREGFDAGHDLPDHLGTVLRFALHFRGEEWADLLKYALLPSFDSMVQPLILSQNPYRHLLRAIQTTLVTLTAMEDCPCSTPFC